MRISEVTQRLGITGRAIRHYENCGLVKPRRDATNTRIFTGTDLMVLTTIINLRRAGLGINDIGQIINGPGTADNLDLERLLDHLERRRVSLERQQRELSALIDDVSSRKRFEGSASKRGYAVAQVA